MNLNDKVIDDQGNVKTFASGQDARLYYLDFEGNEKKYLLEGDGGGGVELPENIVNTINGQTGDVVIDIPELPEKIVNTFNTFTGDIEYPRFVTHANTETSLTINFGSRNYLGEIAYYQNPVESLTVSYKQASSSNVKNFKDKYVIVKTGENFTGVTVTFEAPYTEDYSEWITNKEFVMEPNKVYLIGCNYPLATIIELENVK